VRSLSAGDCQATASLNPVKRVNSRRCVSAKQFTYSRTIFWRTSERCLLAVAPADVDIEFEFVFESAIHAGSRQTQSNLGTAPGLGLLVAFILSYLYLLDHFGHACTF
jgi:hypothetical protein